MVIAHRDDNAQATQEGEKEKKRLCQWAMQGSNLRLLPCKGSALAN